MHSFVDDTIRYVDMGRTIECLRLDYLNVCRNIDQWSDDVTTCSTFRLTVFFLIVYQEHGP